MKTVACAIGTLMILLGLTGVFWPEGLMKIGQYSLTPVGLYVVATVRLVVGVVFFLAASASRKPRTLRILGVLICLAGVATAVMTVERAQALADWWLAHGLGFVRVTAVGVMIVGGFVAHATAPRRD